MFEEKKKVDYCMYAKDKGIRLSIITINRKER